MKVILAPCAVRDIEEIVNYIKAHDSWDAATHVLDNLEKAVFSLADLLNRGAVVKELEALGIKCIREIHYKSYRVIYEAEAEVVSVFCVVDGRKDLVSLLEKRILGM